MCLVEVIGILILRRGRHRRQEASEDGVWLLEPRESRIARARKRNFQLKTLSLSLSANLDTADPFGFGASAASAAVLFPTLCSKYSIVKSAESTELQPRNLVRLLK